MEKCTKTIYNCASVDVYCLLYINFYLSNIDAEVESVGKITYGKNFQLQDIRLTVKDKSKLQQMDNIDSKIEINYK